ncbi:MAG: hypothetical protein NWE91_03775 [Candidatus Bathyarchaeota archaeon]|nr:hypothetical protein [Candidatus Bathyarchaeota archaeon]
MTRVRIVVSLVLMTVLGVILYFSPIRGDSVKVVGVYACLSAAIIFLVQTTKIEIIEGEEEKIATGIYTFTSIPEEDPSNKTLSYTVGSLDLGNTCMYPTKRETLDASFSSSECQLTLSSLYKPSRATPVDLPQKKRNDHHRTRARTKRIEKIKNGSRSKPAPAKPIPA